MAVGNYESVAPAARSSKKDWGRPVLALTSLVLAVVAVACVVRLSGGSASQKPDVLSFYHMWLASNGLPVSPRKQRELLFQFCTTNFVTEEEMRYCYSRILSDGNPSGPVKYAGMPNYDSDQIVSPLFTFAMPEAEGGAAGGAEGGAEGAASGGEGGAAPAEAAAPAAAPAAAQAVHSAAILKQTQARKQALAVLPPRLPAPTAAQEWAAFTKLEKERSQQQKL